MYLYDSVNNLIEKVYLELIDDSTYYGYVNNTIINGEIYVEKNNITNHWEVTGDESLLFFNSEKEFKVYSNEYCYKECTKKIEELKTELSRLKKKEKYINKILEKHAINTLLKYINFLNQLDKLECNLPMNVGIYSEEHNYFQIFPIKKPYDYFEYFNSNIESQTLLLSFVRFDFTSKPIVLGDEDLYFQNDRIIIEGKPSLQVFPCLIESVSESLEYFQFIIDKINLEREIENKEENIQYYELKISELKV